MLDVQELGMPNKKDLKYRGLLFLPVRKGSAKAEHGSTIGARRICAGNNQLAAVVGSNVFDCNAASRLVRQSAWSGTKMQSNVEDVLARSTRSNSALKLQPLEVAENAPVVCRENAAVSPCSVLIDHEPVILAKLAAVL